MKALIIMTAILATVGTPHLAQAYVPSSQSNAKAKMAGKKVSKKTSINPAKTKAKAREAGRVKTVSTAPSKALPPSPSQLISPIRTPVMSPYRSGGQSTVAIPKVQPTPEAKRFSAKLIDRASIPMNLANGQYDTRVDAQKQDIQANGQMSLRLGYKLSDTTSVGLGTDGEHSYGALNNGKANWTMYDIFASISDSKLMTLPGTIGVKGAFRFYAPSSEASQAAGQIARVRGNLTVNREFGPVNLLYSADPQYYFQSYLTSVSMGESGEEHAGTRSFRLYHYAGVEVTLSPKWNAYTYLGLDQGWYNEDPNFKLASKTKPTADIYAETAVGYAFNDNLSLSLGVVQEQPDMLSQSPGKEGPLYRDEFTRYFVEGTVGF